MTQPRLVIISGPPASGKSRLARPLADKLRFPLLQKDMFKETLAEPFGDRAPQFTEELGHGAVMAMYKVADELLRSGVSTIIESPFPKGKAEPDLKPLIAKARAVLIHVSADPKLVIKRYADRMDSGDRHPVHNAGNQVDKLRRQLREGTTDPLDLPIPLITVDTTDSEPDVDALAAQIKDGASASRAT